MKSRITSADIEKLRKDFLLLMRNVEKVKDYDTALEFSGVARRYADKINEVVYRGLVPWIESQDKTSWWAKEIRKNVWGFYIALQVPINRSPPVTDEVYKWFTPEKNFDRYLQERDRWVAKVKREARTAWTTLKEYLDTKHGSEGVEVEVPGEQQIDMSGFRVVVEGTSTHELEYLDRLDGVLRYFKSRALNVYPPLVTKARTFVLNLHDQEGLGGDAAATYDVYASRVNLSIWVCTANPKGGAKTIAHEMGHHIYETHLSGSDRALWEHLIKNDYGLVDLREVLAVWPEKASHYWIEGSSLAITDPTLYLQIYTAMFPPIKDKEWFQTKEDVEALIAKGQTHIQLPTNPITVYASKNPEEAFCEALGLLVAYGPRAVPEVVRSWLLRLLPNLKIASSGRVALRYLQG